MHTLSHIHTRTHAFVNCRSGADKVSIGSDAVEVAEDYVRSGQKTGTTSIEQISAVYGKQAVVVSIDPRRVYVSDPSQVCDVCIWGGGSRMDWLASRFRLPCGQPRESVHALIHAYSRTPLA